jgi:hypothetical protein
MIGSRRPWAACVLATLPLLLATVAPAGGALWLHVRVEERGSGGENVKLDVPLDTVESLLPLIPSDVTTADALKLGGHGAWQGADLREWARALREAPDADFVTVASGEESVRVGKQGDELVVHVDEPSEKVRVRLPIAVLEALLAGNDPERLDLVAGLRALAAHAGRALVDIESEDEQVRVWVDSTEGGAAWPGDRP